MSVEFEPVKLGPRHRRFDPVILGALLVVVAVGAAVLKPWDRGTGSGSGAGPGVVESGPSGSRAEPTVTLAPVLPRIQAVTAALASVDNVRAALRRHDAWGIRAIVAEPSPSAAPVTDQRFAEIWDELPSGPGEAPTVDVEPNDRTVVAVGLTFPAAHTPLDVRIWLIHSSGLEWIDAKALDASPVGGAFLYRITNPDGSVRNWRAGRYRVDVLVDGAIRRFGFTLPNRFEIVPTDPALPPLPADPVDPAISDVSGLPIGPFVTARGASIPLAGMPGPALSEAEAWLDVDPGTRRAPRSWVATTFQPAATGLGVMLPPGSVVRASSIRRLAPEPLTGEPQLAVDVFDPGHPNWLVLYRAPGGGPWSAGTYGLSIAWTDSAGAHDLTWHFELRPGPLLETPPILAAARAFARYAGGSGVVVGTAEPLEGGPRSVAIRLLHPQPAGAAGFPARDLVRCDGIRVDGLAGVVGIALPVDASPSKVTARVLYEFSRSEEQAILTASGDVPGLMLVAPASDSALTSTVYRLRIGDDPRLPGTTVCLWTTPAA